MSFGGQGARREAGSEGYAEKYRAVVDEGYLKDEPVGQRWDTVEPALWGRRRSHSPTAPRCLRTARYGRSGRDPRRTSRVLGWHRPEVRRTPHHQKHGDGVGRGSQPAKTVEKRQKAR